MKIGTLVTHLFGEDTGTIGVVVGPSNDYWGRPDPDSVSYTHLTLPTTPYV